MKTFKFVILTILLFTAGSGLFALNISLSDLSLTDFVSLHQSGEKSIQQNEYFFWSGIISDIAFNEETATYTVTLINAEWQNKQNLASQYFIITITDPEMVEKAASYHISDRLFCIVAVISVKDKSIPLCKPILIKTK